MGMGICAVAFGTYLGIYHEKIRINYVTDTIVKALMTVLIMMFFNFLLSYKYVSTVNLTNGIKER